MQFSIYSAPLESFSGSHIPSHYTYWRMCLSFLSPLHKKPQLNRFFFFNYLFKIFEIHKILASALNFFKTFAGSLAV